MPSKADTAVARTIGIDREAQSFYAKRSLGPGLPRDL